MDDPGFGMDILINLRKVGGVVGEELALMKSNSQASVGVRCGVWLLLNLMSMVGLSAHEFWLAPSTHHAAIGEKVAINVMIGEGSKAASLERRPSHIRRFQIFDGQTRSDVDGRRFRRPTGRFTGQKVGVHVVSYESEPQLVELTAEKFEKYLLSEGLDEVVLDRQAAGETSNPVRESFSRFAKSLVQVGGSLAGDVPLGLPMEIVALANPFRLFPGDMLVVRVLLEGEPVPGVLVKAFALGDDSVRQGVRTDGTGLARFPITTSGRWLLNAVFMERAEDDKVLDWTSRWASLTFEVPSRANDETLE